MFALKQMKIDMQVSGVNLFRDECFNTSLKNDIV